MKKKIKKILFGFVVIFTVFCSLFFLYKNYISNSNNSNNSNNSEDYEDSTNPNISTYLVALNKTFLNLNLNDSYKLIATISPNNENDTNASKQILQWSSSNSEVVTVSNEGVVHAVGVGSAEISVKTNYSNVATCSINILEQKPKVLSMSVTETYADIGSEFKLNVINIPTDLINKEISWSSYNDNIATVVNGNVKVLSKGEVFIKAKFDENNFVECKVICGDYNYKLVESGNSFGLGYYNEVNKNVVLPSAYNGKSISFLNEGIFKDNSIIESVTIPDSVNVIYKSAFRSCNNLKSIVISNNLQVIDVEAFYFCKNLRNITLPKTLIEIRDRAFTNCINLQEINFPKNLQSIKSSCFSGCTELRKIDLPDSLLTIGDYAFSDCSKIEEIMIGKNTRSINQDEKPSFIGVSKSLKKIIVSSENQYFKDIDKRGLFTKNGKNLLLYANNYNSMTNYDVPNSVQKINSGAFSDADKLVSVKLNDKLLEISNVAFSFCSNLTQIYLNRNLNSISKSAFMGCYKLNINLDENNKYFEWVKKDSNSNQIFLCKKTNDSKRILIWYKYNSNDTEIEIPEGVNVIDFVVFWNYTFNKITLPVSLTDIEKILFMNNFNSLKTIKYKGTASQWGKITKNSQWSNGLNKSLVVIFEGDTKVDI